MDRIGRMGLFNRFKASTSSSSSSSSVKPAPELVQPLPSPARGEEELDYERQNATFFGDYVEDHALPASTTATKLHQEDQDLEIEDTAVEEDQTAQEEEKREADDSASIPEEIPSDASTDEASQGQEEAVLCDPAAPSTQDEEQEEKALIRIVKPVARRHQAKAASRSVTLTITNAAIKRMQLRAGIPRLQGKAKHAIRAAYVALTKVVLEKAIIYKQYRGKVILEESDIVRGTAHIGMKIYTE